MPEVPIGNVVDEIYLGKTRVRFCDDVYRNKTPEELHEDDVRLVNVCYEAARATMIREMKKKKNKQKEELQSVNKY